MKREKPGDVAVVGASAAGLYTAYLLARRAVPVRVIEQGERLEPAPRTLIATSRLRDVLGGLCEPAVVNEIRRFDLIADGHRAAVALARPDLVVERSTLIRTLAEQAEAAGARLFLGQRFSRVEPRNGTLAVTVDQGQQRTEVRATSLVGADGVDSSVRAAAGWPRQPTVPLLQALVRPPRDLPADTTRVWFVPDETPYFYWLIPESPERGVLGLIGEDGPATRRCLERFLERQRLEPLAFQGARIPLYTRTARGRRRLGSGDVYLVGDAAGQVKVTTVGGLVTGFRGARGVAEAIARGGPGAGLRALRRELDLHLLVRRMLHPFSQADYSRLLALLTPSARAPLEAHTRDEPARLLWSLCLRQPRLLLLGLRGLLLGGPGPRSRP